MTSLIKWRSAGMLSKLNPYSQEFIPQSNQRQLDYHAYPTQPMILNPSAEEYIPQLIFKSLPKNPLMFNPSAEEFIPQLISQSLSKNKMFNPSESQTLNPCCEELKNCTSEETGHNTVQYHSALDENSTPITSKARGSFISGGNKAELRPKKTFLEECFGDVAEGDNQTADHSQEESQPTKSWAFNPSAKPFFLLVRNASPSSRNTNETSASLEQKHEELDPMKTSLTPKLSEFLRKSLNTSRLAPKESFRKRLDECIEHAAADDVKNDDNSQDSHLTESQKLNQWAQICIPHPTNMPTCLVNTEAKNYNPEEIPAVINADKTPISHELPALPRMCPNSIAQVTEDTVEAQKSCHSQEDHVDSPTHQVESSTLNPTANTFMPLLIKMSQVSHKIDTYIAKNSEELPSLSSELRNCTSIVHETDVTSQNVLQNHSALDVNNTPVTKCAGGSFILRGNKADPRPRKTFLEECFGDVTEGDNQTADHSQEESQPTKSWAFNPLAKPFFSLVRNASPSSRNTNETSASLEQKHEELDPVKTSITPKLSELLRKSRNNCRLAQMAPFRNMLDECIEHAVDDDAETTSNLQDSQFTDSQMLNPCAQMFIPHPKSMPPGLRNKEAKKYNLEEIPTLSNADNTPLSYELTTLSRVCPNGITQATEDTVEAQTSCHSQKNHFDFPTHQVESSTLNPNANTFMHLLRKMSQVSHKTDSYVAKNSGELSETLLHNSEIQSECESLSYEPSQDKFQPSPSSELRNCTSIVQHGGDVISQKVLQIHSALDVYNTPITSNAGESFIERGNGHVHRQRETFLEECVGDVAEGDNQTAGHSQEESQPTKSWAFNPSAKPFISLVRNASPSSRNTNETSASLEQKHSELDPKKTSLTQKVKEVLRKLTNNSRLARMESSRKGLNECIEHATDDDAQIADNSQDSQLTESQKLNPCAHIFIPYPTNIPPILLNTEDKNYNLEEIPSVSNGNNTPFSFELATLSSVYSNGIAQVTEDTVEAQTSCPVLEDDLELPTHHVELSTLNPNVKTFIPQLKNMSQVSHKTDSRSLKNCVELSETPWHHSETEREYMTVYELNQDQLHSSLSAEDNTESPNVLNRDVAMCSSTHTEGDISTLRSTTVTAAERTIADDNNMSPVKVDILNNDLRRIPRHPHLRTIPQNDEFMDIPNQHFSAWLEHDARVTDEPGRDLTNLAVRLERAEMEAQRLRLKVSTMTTDHALARTQLQLQIKILHKKMATDKKALTNMQVHTLDLMKQVAISRVDKKLMQAELRVSHLYEAMGDRVCTSEMQNAYQVLCSYMTDCNVLKLEIEMLAQKFQEKLQNGKQIDMSVMDKYPPSFPELHF